jgi:hypothetical protein
MDRDFDDDWINFLILMVQKIEDLGAEQNSRESLTFESCPQSGQFGVPASLYNTEYDRHQPKTLERQSFHSQSFVNSAKNRIVFDSRERP